MSSMDVEQFFNLSIRLNASRANDTGVSCWPDGCLTPHPSITSASVIGHPGNGSISIDDVLAGHHEKQPKVYWALVMIILPLLAILGNILVIVSVYKEKSLQSVTNYFIVSLAVADMLVGGFVMPFAVYFLVNVDWELSETICDFWIAIDVTLSTASILNLVAISIDRFMAVTRPIKYAKHKSNNRVMFTIAIVWIISVTIGSPIVLGLNTSPERTPELCIFYNSDFIIYSSLGSFYIPCVLMVILYYRIFKAIRERAKKPIGSSRGNHTTQQPTKAGRNRTAGVPREGTPSGDASQALVIENVHSKSSRSAIDRMRSPLPVISGSVAISSPDLEVHEEDEDEEESEAEDAVECKVIENVAAADLERRLHSHSLNRGRTNGNPDSGYVVSHVEETQFCLRNPHTKDEATDEEEDFEMKDKFFDLEEGKVKNSKQTAETVGVVNSKEEEEEEESPSLEERLGRASTSASPAAALANASTSSTSATEKEKEKKDSPEKGRTGKGSSEEGKKKLRFHLRRKTKTTDPQKKREKASAKRERKATKTLAIVLGVFLFCWVPFFTCNIIDAICIKLEKPDCRLSTTAFLLTTWLGYINSIVNPVIYTIFNPEFRKAFKKILGFKP